MLFEKFIIIDSGVCHNYFICHPQRYWNVSACPDADRGLSIGREDQI